MFIYLFHPSFLSFLPFFLPSFLHCSSQGDVDPESVLKILGAICEYTLDEVSVHTLSFCGIATHTNNGLNRTNSFQTSAWNTLVNVL